MGGARLEQQTEVPLVFLKQLHEAPVSVCPSALSGFSPSAGVTLLRGCRHHAPSRLEWQARECTKCLQLFSRLCTKQLLR